MRGSLGWSLLIGLLLLAACGSRAYPAPQEAIAESGSAVPTVTAASPIPALAEAAEGAGAQQPTTTDPAAVAAEPAELVEEPAELPAPTPRTELEATDPREVSLASGGLQLVEFFAYW